MPKLSIEGILEKLGKLNQSNPIRYMINGVKNKKKLNFVAFWPHGSLAVGLKELKELCWSNFFQRLTRKQRKRNFEKNASSTRIL